ncbi:MAG: hypothetical protein WC362_05530 [Methanoregula sp.]
MQFITIYKKFLHDQGKLKDSKYSPVMVETISFLLDNAIGLDNAIPTDKIIIHLQSKGYKIKKETWQIRVLGPLRDNGIYIGSKRGTSGMFLIKTKDDALATRTSIYNRMLVEQRRKKKLEKIMDNLGWDYT